MLLILWRLRIRRASVGHCLLWLVTLFVTWSVQSALPSSAVLAYISRLRRSWLASGWPALLLVAVLVAVAVVAGCFRGWNLMMESVGLATCKGAE